MSVVVETDLQIGLKNRQFSSEQGVEPSSFSTSYLDDLYDLYDPAIVKLPDFVPISQNTFAGILTRNLMPGLKRTSISFMDDNGEIIEKISEADKPQSLGDKDFIFYERTLLRPTLTNTDYFRINKSHEGSDNFSALFIGENGGRGVVTIFNKVEGEKENSKKVDVEPGMVVFLDPHLDHRVSFIDGPHLRYLYLSMSETTQFDEPADITETMNRLPQSSLVEPLTGKKYSPEGTTMKKVEGQIYERSKYADGWLTRKSYEDADYADTHSSLVLADEIKSGITGQHETRFRALVVKPTTIFEVKKGE